MLPQTFVILIRKRSCRIITSPKATRGTLFSTGKGRLHQRVAGAWNRPLFVGGWEHSDSQTETVFNLQTPSIFIDMRIPRKATFPGARSLQDLTVRQLRLYARRHAFAGYTRVQSVDGAPVAVRHHSIDWNFVGKVFNKSSRLFRSILLATYTDSHWMNSKVNTGDSLCHRQDYSG